MWFSLSFWNEIDFGFSNQYDESRHSNNKIAWFFKLFIDYTHFCVILHILNVWVSYWIRIFDIYITSDRQPEKNQNDFSSMSLSFDSSINLSAYNLESVFESHQFKDYPKSRWWCIKNNEININTHMPTNGNSNHFNKLPIKYSNFAHKTVSS